MDFLKMLLKRIVVLLIFYQLCRLLFLVFNYHYFAPISFAGLLYMMYGGIRFDLSALLYLNVVYIFLFILPLPIRFNRIYQLTGKVIFIFTNSIGIIANLMDCAYFPFILRRTSAAFFLEFRNEAGLLKETGKYVASYWYIALLIIFFTWLLWKTYDWIKMPDRRAFKTRKFLLEIALLPFVFIVWLGFARGSFIPHNRPLNISHAGDYTDNPAQVNVVLNTPFCIMTTWGNTQLPEVNYFPSLSEAAVYYSPVQSYSRSPLLKKNVIIIVVESLSREFVGSLNSKVPGVRGYTPFIDSLILRSLTFRYGFANGKHSIEALPSVLASIPSLTESYVVTEYANNRINSIPGTLKKYGYHTSFFHGGHERAMGFSAFTNIAGVDHQYSMKDYNNDKDYDGTWGIYDGDFMPFWADKMNSFPQPFCSTIFTVSMHTPYKIPDEMEGKFDKGTMPIHPTVEYFDYSLKKFFEKISTMPWYKNSVFIITADHAASYAYYPEYYNTMGAFAVPVIFFTPDSSLTGFHDALAQQCDIFPTLMDYLGIQDSILAFGESLLRHNPDHLVVNCYSGIYQAFKGDWMLQFDGKKPVALYKYKDDMKMQNNLLAEHPEVVQNMLPELKAYIQQYCTRLRENKMLP